MMIKMARSPALVLGALLGVASSNAHAAMTPELQQSIRASTFEVVMKKPEKDPLSYEKPLPLDLIPYIERNDAYRSMGTAFALGNNVYVTAAHVIEAGVSSQFGPPALRRSDGTVFTIDKILKFSAHEDFVVFSLKQDPQPPGLPVNRDPKLDQAVLAVGNALGEGIVIRDGLFTSETAEAQDGRWKWIRFSAAASPGNSGGPLCDENGRVIGIVIGKSPNENLNYSLPISRVLDAEQSKARFEQRGPVGLPFTHATVTYSIKGDFGLPLGWSAFNDALVKFLQQHDDESRALVLKTYADTLFPKGPGSDDLLFEPAPGPRPRIILQSADGNWSAPEPQYNEVRLSSDGSIASATAASAKLIHLVRPAAASDDAFYEDSKAFMDFVLKGLDLRRVVGTDQVRVTSLGAAVQTSVFTDQYGRRWQDRAWAIPYLDSYAVGSLLPTPDGYAGIMILIPSAGLHSALENLHLLANLLEVSYRGTLAQWQAALRRRSLLPKALENVKLDKTPTWTLKTPKFVSSVPGSVMQLKDDSPMSLGMGFMSIGNQIVWDVEEVRWEPDERHESAVVLWRRAEPPADAQVDLRNRFDSIRARRTPYDGMASRDSETTMQVTRVLDVPGKTPGSISSNPQYGLTVRLAGLLQPTVIRESIEEVSAVTQILERGIGSDMPRPNPTAGLNRIPSGSGEPADLLEKFERDSMAEATAMDGTLGADIRGRHPSDDMSELIRVIKLESRGISPGDSEKRRARLDEAKRLVDWLRSYWNESSILVHSRDLWADFLQRNQMPPDTPHAPAVLAAEKQLEAALGRSLSGEWAEQAHALREAYLDERKSLVKSARPEAPNYIERTGACPPAATTTSGSKNPKPGQAEQSLDELWPAQSKRLGEEGTVVASLQISSRGCVTALAIVGSSGSNWMDRAVRDYFEAMPFLPGDVGGKAVDTHVTIPVTFRLNGDAPAWASK
jgi:serine protease Do